MNSSEKLKETQLPQKKRFILALMTKVLVMRITCIRKKFENVRNEKPIRLP